MNRLSATPNEGMLRKVSITTTQGILVEIENEYLDHQSVPEESRYVFMYTVTITNEGEETVQLRTRHWIITDANEEIREVKGVGVVGQQPVLKPGDSHQYRSGCILKTPWGTMHGSYHFEHHLKRETGFDAEIAPFLLAAPTVTSAQTLN